MEKIIETILFFNRCLFEERGHNDDIIEAANDIINAIKDSDEFAKFVKNPEEGACFPFVVENGTFFSKAMIDIIWRESHATYYNGGYNALTAVFDKEKNIFEIPIRISIESDNLKYFLRFTGAAIAHELMHAYEDYQRRLKGGNGLSRLGVNGGYAEAVKGLSSTQAVVRKLSDIIYGTRQSELNAQINQAYKEIVDMDFAGANKTIITAKAKETSAYQIYLRLLNDLDYLRNITDKDTQKEVLDFFNEKISPKMKVYSYIFLMTLLTSRVEKYRKRFDNKFFKVLFDAIYNTVGYL